MAGILRVDHHHDPVDQPPRRRILVDQASRHPLIHIDHTVGIQVGVGAQPVPVEPADIAQHRGRSTERNRVGRDRQRPLDRILVVD
ncbi:MAG TPA: hypothetical protein VHX40_02815 [Acidimicrobiales bacterium]|nr:hypothetical protein [Acidimicrobiales bacterium]